MITPQASPGQPPGWQDELADSITDPAELLDALSLDPALLPHARQAASRFPLRVPRCFVNRMASGDPDDPLLRQVLPLHLELEDRPDDSVDPVGDRQATKARGILRKYHGRVLLIASGACAINCRYCFRREFPYSVNIAASRQWQSAVDVIRTDSSITEVILSGGDPLTLRTPHLVTLTKRLEGIKHVRSLRIHSRLPVVLPSRIDRELLDWLENCTLGTVFVIHANHANEFDREVVAACRRLRETGVMVFNQSVLLKGVNDSADAIARLSRASFSAGVLPYYLHMLDKVQGAGHFEVPERRAVRIMETVAAKLPGYLVPKLVRERAGAPFKIPVPGIGSGKDVSQVAEHAVEPM
jgi:EF-P beta-lysylation protein EpmB